MELTPDLIPSINLDAPRKKGLPSSPARAKKQKHVFLPLYKYLIHPETYSYILV